MRPGVICNGMPPGCYFGKDARELNGLFTYDKEGTLYSQIVHDIQEGLGSKGVRAVIEGQRDGRYALRAGVMKGSGSHVRF